MDQDQLGQCDVTAVYDDPAVRRRFFEFLGGESPEEATAIYVTRADGLHLQPDEMKATGDFPRFLGEEQDIARSLLDRRSLLAHLDVEYVNFDSPAECFLNPLKTFALQQPVIDAIEEQLLEFGIRPLHLLTGQGHHFVWRMERDSGVVGRLGALVPAGVPVGRSAPQAFLEDCASEWIKAFSGLGLVMEFLAMRIKASAAPHTRIPIKLTAVHVGRGGTGAREIVSIDVSEYGDPLWTRAVRMPFTRYLKPWQNGLARALGIEDRISPFFTLPLHEMDFSEAIRVRQSADETRALARRACVRIPEQSQGADCLLDAYLASPLRRFHQGYYAEVIDRRMRVASWIGRLPPCARHILENPNDCLLKPAGMQLVTRCLLALGAGARQIASMLAAVFSDSEHAWGQQWDNYSAEMRSDFYTRLFSGQIAVGLDSAIDFNCVSTQEKGFCFDACGCNLKPFQEKLARVQKEMIE